MRTSSNLVDCTTGKSAGFAPFRMRPGVDADVAICISQTCAVAYQSADFGMMAVLVYCRNRVACRQLSQFLDPPVEQEGCATDDEGIGSLAHKSGERGIEFEAGASVENLDLQPHGASSCSHVPQCSVSTESIGRIDEHGNTNGSGHERAESFRRFDANSVLKTLVPSTTTWPGEACDKTKPDRVYAGKEDNGDRGGCRLGRGRGRDTSDRGDHGDPSLHQFRRQRRQPIGLTVGPAVFDGHARPR